MGLHNWTFTLYCAPKSKVHPLSIPETQPMEEYIEEALAAAGLIWLCTSSAAARFFFVEKKNGGLRPWISYRGHSAITIGYHYPLSLILPALEKLIEAHIFNKFIFWSTYNFICIQERGWMKDSISNLLQ